MPIAFPSLNFTFTHIGLHLYIPRFPSNSQTRGAMPFFCTHNEKALTCATEHLQTERQVIIVWLHLFRTTRIIINNETKYITRIIVLCWYTTAWQSNTVSNYMVSSHTKEETSPLHVRTCSYCENVRHYSVHTHIENIYSIT